MGIVIPRPAMRAREERIIRARLAAYDVRLAELICQGIPKDKASPIAFKHAAGLKFNRKGEVQS